MEKKGQGGQGGQGRKFSHTSLSPVSSFQVYVFNKVINADRN